MAGRGVGIDGLPGLLQARFLSRSIGGPASTGRGTDAASTDRREKKAVPRCFPTPASSQRVHPESSPPEASIGGVSSKSACRSSCVATEANGLRTSSARLPTASRISRRAYDEEPRVPLQLESPTDQRLAPRPFGAKCHDHLHQLDPVSDGIIRARLNVLNAASATKTTTSCSLRARVIGANS